MSLFSGEDQLSIHLLVKNSFTFLTTNYIRWFDGARQHLFSLIYYTNSTDNIIRGGVAKIGTKLEQSILNKIRNKKISIMQYFTRTGKHSFHFRNASGSYYRLFCIEPPFIKVGNKHIQSTTLQKRFTTFDPRSLVAALSSNLFNWFWVVFSDNYHITSKELNEFKFTPTDLGNNVIAKLQNHCNELMKDYDSNSSFREELDRRNNQKRKVQIFEPRKSKNIMDKIDKELAQYYGFTEEELDFIINYDIKYRMGLNSQREDN